MNRNNVVKNILSNYYKTKFFKFVICYITFGILVFTFSNMDLTYVNMIYYIMGHPYLISFFLIPVLIFTSLQIISYVNHNKCLLLTLETRERVFKMQLEILLKNISVIFIIFLFITMLFTNVFSNRNAFIQVDPYYSEINNLIGLVILLFKLLVFVISITLFNIPIVKGKNSIFIFIFDLLCLLSFLGYVPSQVSYLFPSHYVGYSYQFKSLILNLLFSSIYLAIIYIFAYVFLKKQLLKRDYR